MFSKTNFCSIISNAISSGLREKIILTNTYIRCQKFVVENLAPIGGVSPQRGSSLPLRYACPLMAYAVGVLVLRMILPVGANIPYGHQFFLPHILVSKDN